MKNNLTSSQQISLCVCLMILVLLALGCNLARLAKLNANYFESDAAQVAAEAFKEKIGKPFRVFEITITPEGIMLQAQDPNNPRNLDLYKDAAGFVVGPTPVQVSATQHGNLEQTTFPFDEINFAAVPTIVQESVSRAGLEGGRVARMTFQRGFAISKKDVGNLGNARWLIEIEGTRESATARADPNGKLLGVDLSRTSQAENYTVITDEELQKAQNAIITTLGKDAQIFFISISNKSILLEVPHPENPKREKRYIFGVDGLTAGNDFGYALSVNVLYPPMTFSEIKLTDAVRLIEKAKEKSGLRNGTLSNIEIKIDAWGRDISNNRRQAVMAPIEWKISLEDGEKEASVSFDLKGNIIEEK